MEKKEKHKNQTTSDTQIQVQEQNQRKTRQHALNRITNPIVTNPDDNDLEDLPENNYKE